MFRVVLHCDNATRALERVKAFSGAFRPLVKGSSITLTLDCQRRYKVAIAYCEALGLNLVSRNRYRAVYQEVSYEKV